MIRSTRLGLLVAVSASLLALTGCSSTPTDSEPVVIARTTPDPTTPHRASEVPRRVTTAAAPAPAEGVIAETPSATAPDVSRFTEPSDTLNSEDLLFLSYITEFTLMEKPESDQIRLGLAMCNSLYRGQSKPDLTAEYLGDGRYTRAEVANVLSAATVAYCPEFV
ncbi:DUF732 domain-containing protein [Rhodococcus sp. ACT016]|uniref:DUF732 domain-containing protein n=1 Tax=Rhodococcus sp. ACT016 TaxID=3134808 RepID=UPI003D2D843C